MLFNRNPIRSGATIKQPSQDLVKNTLSLWSCSLEDAVKYGGELTREALSNIPLVGGYKHTIVDTKVHMLIKGFCPAIPGYHTDHTPRGKDLNPLTKDQPNIHLQETNKAPTLHLLVTGNHCLTDFLVDPLDLNIPEKPTSDLFKIISEQVNQKADLKKMTADSCRWYSWDWWNLHTGVIASGFEWRYLIRVTETDYQEPEKDLRKIIRTQQNVYVPQSIGW